MPSSSTDRPAPRDEPHDAAAAAPPAPEEQRRPQSLADLSPGTQDYEVDRPVGPRLGAGDINWATGAQPVIEPASSWPAFAEPTAARAAVFAPTPARRLPTDQPAASGPPATNPLITPASPAPSSATPSDLPPSDLPPPSAMPPGAAAAIPQPRGRRLAVERPLDQPPARHSATVFSPARDAATSGFDTASPDAATSGHGAPLSSAPDAATSGFALSAFGQSDNDQVAADEVWPPKADDDTEFSFARGTEPARENPSWNAPSRAESRRMQAIWAEAGLDEPRTFEDRRLFRSRRSKSAAGGKGAAKAPKNPADTGSSASTGPAHLADSDESTDTGQFPEIGGGRRRRGRHAHPSEGGPRAGSHRADPSGQGWPLIGKRRNRAVLAAVAGVGLLLFLVPVKEPLNTPGAVEAARQQAASSNGRLAADGGPGDSDAGRARAGATAPGGTPKTAGGKPATTGGPAGAAPGVPEKVASPATTQPARAQVPAPPVGQGPAGSLRTTGTDAVALTFDDGPDPVQTPKLIALLAQHRVRAMFCLVGEQAAKYPDLVRKIVKAGHTLCNHTWSHSLTIGTAEPAQITADLERTNSAIRAAVPEAQIPFFRAPGGNFTERLVKTAWESHMTSLYWAVDPRDWEHPAGETADQHVDRIVKQLHREVRPGSIVLSHDFNQPDTIRAYRQLLPGMAAKFTFGTPARPAPAVMPQVTAAPSVSSAPAATPPAAPVPPAETSTPPADPAVLPPAATETTSASPAVSP